MNLASILEDHHADHPAIISRGRTLTYGELNDRVRRVRGGLAALGLNDGDRLALLVGNAPAFPIADLAALGLGLVVVPLNPQSPAAELEHQLAAVGTRAVVADGRGLGSLAGLKIERVPSLEHVIAVDGDTPVHDGHGAAPTTTLAELAAAEPHDVVDLDPGHLAALIFTSGTAGGPRAAMLTHANLRANIDQSLSLPHRMHPGDTVYSVLPLFHIMGYNSVLHLALTRGATIVLVQRFDPATAIDSIRDRGITVVPGAPSMWVAFAEFEPVDPAAFASVRLALSGAAKLPEDIARMFCDRYGVPIREGYGLTEASPVVTTSVEVNPKIGSIGVPLPGVEMRLVDEDGDPVLTGDAGEIWVRGANVFVGYWEDPEATARALTPDGWLRTGDVAVVDDDGYVFLVDRVKDLINVSGFNVFPAEVEEVIDRLTGVVESAVVGVPHPHTGEAVKAYVVTTADSSLDEDQVVAHVEANLARYKVPSKVLFVDELPRNLSGKLLRRALR